MYVTFYGRFYGKVDACANGVYQALSPPLKGPGDEAILGLARFSLVPSPKSPRGEGSGDIGTVSWLYRRVISCQYYAINHVPGPRCYGNAMHNQRTAFSLASAKPPADIARSLLRDQMQGHMKIVELQSDWLSQK